MHLIRPRSESKIDEHGNKVTRHWDGRQDVMINAKTARRRAKKENDHG